MAEEYAQVEVESRDAWRAWLAMYAGESPGIWLVTWKKGRGPYVPYDEIVDEALCFGWVDSRPRSIDADRSSRLLTPRRPGSSWSRVNKARVERLIETHAMAPAGLAAVEQAKADGSWNALDLVEELIEPDDLRSALDAVPEARGNWDGFPRSTRRAILEWIGAARADATRERRIGQTVAEAAVGRRANQWRQPEGG